MSFLRDACVLTQMLVFFCIHCLITEFTSLKSYIKTYVMIAESLPTSAVSYGMPSF